MILPGPGRAAEPAGHPRNAGLIDLEDAEGTPAFDQPADQPSGVAVDVVFGPVPLRREGDKPDAVADPQALRLRTRINGELRQSSSTGNMIFSCAQLIHFFSVNFTLRPGTVIITGTPGGTAWSVDPELGGEGVGGDGSEALVPAKGYLKPGDVIESELEKIGVLRNVVGTASARA